MSALPNGTHTLEISGSDQDGYVARCRCRMWRADQDTRKECRELHDAHIQDVLSETEANDAARA